MTDFVAFLVFGGALLAAVGIGEALRAWGGLRPEASRRAVHSLVGLMVAACPPLFSSPSWIYVLAVGFIGVNLVAIPRGLFPGMHAIARKSWGTVTFPLALVLALYTCWTLDPGRIYILQTAFLVLAVSDPLASLVGMGLARPGRFRVDGHTKSVAGSAAFFVSAVLLVAGALAILGPDGWTLGQIVLGAVVAASLATVAEALGDGGWDNLWIVAAVILVLTVLHPSPDGLGRLGIALVVAVAFGVLTVRVRFLTLSGAMAAGLLAFGVVGLGGWAWVLPGFTFFVLSSLLSKMGRRRKAAAESLAEKSSQRDAGQVVANGGIAGLLLAATVFWPHPALYWGFVGAFAAAAADTWGTEIGTYVGGPTRQILTGRRVPPGTSGGVSIAGTLGALLGAATVVGSALPFAVPFSGGLPGTGVLALALVSGFIGALFDSTLGASLQARYLTPDGRLTERTLQDGQALPLAKGYRWVTNDRVNLGCTLAGGTIPLLVLLLG